VLRRTQAIKTPDDISAMRAEIERAFTPNPELRDPTQLPPEIERPFTARVERGTEARPRMRASAGFRPSRLLLVAVAVIAGGIAAFLALQRGEALPEPVREIVTEVVPAPTARVLVASRTIGVGQQLTAESLVWADWPIGSLRPEFITGESMPDAMTVLAGASARYEFFPGEPIRQQKLAPDGNSFLAVVLEPGMRAVSVPITPEAASGGFIQPDDRVDVVMTASARGHASTTILSNVRVLAINSQLGGGASDESEEADTSTFEGVALATLALDQVQAEMIATAQVLGKLTLVLRPMSETTAPDTALSAANQSIRFSSPFWNRQQSD
jgi:pilus assembly protein CpaB